MTRGELITLVRGVLEDPDGSSYSTAEIVSAIDEGQLLFSAFSLCLESTVTFTPASARIHMLTHASDYLVPLRVSDADGNKVRPARLADLDALDRTWSTATTGNASARYAALGSDLLVLHPFAAGKALSVVHARAAAALANDSAVPEIPALYHPVLAEYGVYRCWAPMGGSMLAKALPHLEAWRAAAAAAADVTRARGKDRGYDTLPFELAKHAAPATNRKGGEKKR